VRRNGGVTATPKMVSFQELGSVFESVRCVHALANYEHLTRLITRGAVH
jgi:hypothetical protein